MPTTHLRITMCACTCAAGADGSRKQQSKHDLDSLRLVVVWALTCSKKPSGQVRAAARHARQRCGQAGGGGARGGRGGDARERFTHQVGFCVWGGLQQGASKKGLGAWSCKASVPVRHKLMLFAKQTHVTI